MGLYDTLELPAALSLPNCDRDPATIEWQTKSIDRPRMDTYRLTVDGVLLEEEWHAESVPKEERPYYGTDEWDQRPILRMAGSRRRVHEGWSVRQYHGIVECHRSIDDEYVAYEIRFTDGRADAIRQTMPVETDWQPFGALVDASETTPRPSDRLSTTQVIHLRALLDDLAEEITADHPAPADHPSADRNGDRWQSAQHAITTLQAYIDWRENHHES